MELQENPFYILDVSVRATKQEILAAAEDKSLFEDFETVENAKNALLDSSRRLEAELAWFPSASDADCDVLKQLADPTCPYYELLRNWISGDAGLLGEIGEIVRDLDPYDTINVKLLMFEAKDYAAENDRKVLGKDILKIIEEYESYCRDYSRSLCDVINMSRSAVGFPTVTQDDVDAMLDKRRDSIFSAVISVLNKQSGAASRAAMVYLAWYGTNGMKERGALLTEKLFEWYEISNQEILTSTYDGICAALNKIEEERSDAERLSEIEQIGRDLRAWVDLTKVLHCFYRSKGKEYEKTLELLAECRNVCIFLNNECERPDLALKLAVTVKNSKAFLFYKKRQKQAEEEIELLHSEADKREQILKYEAQQKAKQSNIAKATMDNVRSAVNIAKSKSECGKDGNSAWKEIKAQYLNYHGRLHRGVFFKRSMILLGLNYLPCFLLVLMIPLLKVLGILNNLSGIFMVFFLPIMLSLILFNMVSGTLLSIQRLHDLNLSGWAALLLPAVGIFLGIKMAAEPEQIYYSYIYILMDCVWIFVLWFVDGSAMPNRWGIPPETESKEEIKILKLQGNLGRKVFAEQTLYKLGKAGLTFSLISVIANVQTGIGNGILHTGMQILMCILSISCIIFLLTASIAMLTFGIRRFHDLEKSGWMLLLLFVPVLNLWAAFCLYFKQGIAESIERDLALLKNWAPDYTEPSSQTYPEHIGDDENYIRIDAHMGAAWYVDRRSLIKLGEKLHQCSLQINVVSVANANEGNKVCSEPITYYFRYQLDTEQIYGCSSKSPQWRYLDRNACWAETGVILPAGEMAFKLAYNKIFYSRGSK